MLSILRSMRSSYSCNKSDASDLRHFSHRMGTCELIVSCLFSNVELSMVMTGAHLRSHPGVLLAQGLSISNSSIRCRHGRYAAACCLDT